MNIRLLLPIITAAVLLSSCAPLVDQRSQPVVLGPAKAVLIPGSGTYSRAIDTDSAEAQQFFDQGLRLSWGFFFPESIASYQQAAMLDPTSPMPYWGMALAMGPNPNSRYSRMPDDPKGEGLKAIKNALQRIDRASALERQLIEALYVLYNKEAIADDDQRDRAYLDQVRALNKQYPEDPDIAALYAAAYMSIGRWDYWDSEGRPKSETEPVAQALEHIINQDNTHPGVLHLHIHLLEASLEPERALYSADSLEATVPIAGHMVHMPAHIYVRVGQFAKAVASNQRSLLVDQQFAKLWGDLPLPNLGTYPLSHRIHAGHAIAFIRYAATVQGNYETANAAGMRAQNRALANGSTSRGFQKTVAAPWLVNKIFGQWDQFIGSEPAAAGTPYLDGIWAYTKGSALIATGDMAGAEAQLKALRAIADDPNADQYRVGATPASAVLKLSLYGLSGEIMQAKGDLDGAVDAFTKGVALEDLNNYTEPPDWAQPMRHYLGAALLEAGRPVAAEAVYRRDLRWNQGNGWSLFGLQQALTQQGKTAEAALVMSQFVEAWQYSNVVLSRSRL
ncbi:MAG: tetratricopeptide (TPR) repeat protein [Paraglaciecola psychrophila]